MNISEIIYIKRKENNLTQQQIAEYLGVSIPAVNKWEKGVSCPDIGLLTPLAKILKTDVNTLLSFKDQLTDKEIGDYINTISSSMVSEGYENTFNSCIEKIKEYPNCHKLILNVSINLMGNLYIYNVANKEHYQETLYKLYEQCTQSSDQDVKNYAISLLIKRSLEIADYDTAQAYISTLPAPSQNKNMLQGNLYLTKGEEDKAQQIFEAELLKQATDILSVLVTLMDMAIKQNRNDDAIYISQVIKKANKLFELWDYNICATNVQLYTLLQDKDNTIKALKDMLDAVKQPIEISKSKLYKSINKKQQSDDDRSQLLSAFITMIENDNDKEFEFIKTDERFINLLNKYK